MKFIHYFSDSAASQYKYHKNFTNLCNHYSDFNINTDWNFFATSHGKGICDGVGGHVKRLIARASLQATTQCKILNSVKFFQWSRDDIKGTEFIYVSSHMIPEHGENTIQRLASSKTIPGTQIHHCFVPTENGVEIFRCSQQFLGRCLSLIISVFCS